LRRVGVCLMLHDSRAFVPLLAASPHLHLACCAFIGLCYSADRVGTSPSSLSPISSPLPWFEVVEAVKTVEVDAIVPCIVLPVDAIVPPRVIPAVSGSHGDSAATPMSTFAMPYQIATSCVERARVLAKYGVARAPSRAIAFKNPCAVALHKGGAVRGAQEEQ
jgi:hypothetical protein